MHLLQTSTGQGLRVRLVEGRKTAGSHLDSKTSGGASNIDSNREDKRRRRRECFVRTKEGDYEPLGRPVKHGEDYHVEFRISPHAEVILRKTASLFKMKPNAYAKAVVYRDIGFYEPKDRRGASSHEDQS